jgi:hypothetical protein
MSFKEILKDFEWNINVRLGIIFSFTSVLIGLAFSEINFFILMIRAILPILMLLFPYIFLYLVPRRFYFKAPPKEYVFVFAWALIAFNLLEMFFYY